MIIGVNNDLEVLQVSKKLLKEYLVTCHSFTVKGFHSIPNLKYIVCGNPYSVVYDSYYFLLINTFANPLQLRVRSDQKLFQYCVPLKSLAALLCTFHPSVADMPSAEVYTETKAHPKHNGS